jgi:uncharacterized protein YceH (UPF0502 family)
LDEVERLLGDLAERGYARRLGRRPGQKEDRFEHLLGGADDGSAESAGTTAFAPAAATAPPAAFAPAAPSSSRAPDDLTDRVTALEAEVQRLEGELAQLRDELGISPEA